MRARARYRRQPENRSSATETVEVDEMLDALGAFAALSPAPPSTPHRTTSPRVPQSTPCRPPEWAMPRRSPARVRADTHRRCRTDERIPPLRGLSPRGRAGIARLERTRLWPGASAEALQAWKLFVHEPMHRLWDPHCGCGVPQCCPDPAELRRTLILVAHAIPPKDARIFRKQLAILDELW